MWVRWESIVEEGLREYRLERSTDLQAWSEVGVIPAQGRPSQYAFADKEVPARVGSVFYRLWAEEESGGKVFGPVEVVLEAWRPVRIRQVALRPDEPLAIELLSGDDFHISVWAPTGQRVWEDEVTGPGSYTIPNVVFGRGMHLVQVRTARGELYVYRILRL